MKVLKELRAKFRLYAMNKGSSFDNIDIDEIPKQWENFPNTEDKWVFVELPKSEDATACLYEGKKGSFFKPHRHPTQIEHLIVLHGKIEVITYNAVSTIQFPESTSFEKGEVHACQFLEDSKILVIWSPKFKHGWKAEFQK